MFSTSEPLATVATRMGADNWQILETYMDTDFLGDIHSTDPNASHTDQQSGVCYFNFSFPRQLDFVLSQVKTEPANKLGFFVTANSAIPIAHSVCGYFDEKDLSPPPIDYVNANSDNSRQYGSAVSAIERQKRSELRRLSATIKSMGLTHAAVIDQYVERGVTLRYASSLLVQAGLHPTSVFPIGGRWFNNLGYRDEDKPQDLLRTRPHEHPFAAYFYMIGALAAREDTTVSSTRPVFAIPANYK